MSALLTIAGVFLGVIVLGVIFINKLLKSLKDATKEAERNKIAKEQQDLVIALLKKAAAERDAILFTLAEKNSKYREDIESFKIYVSRMQLSKLLGVTENTATENLNKITSELINEINNTSSTKNIDGNEIDKVAKLRSTLKTISEKRTRKNKK